MKANFVTSLLAAATLAVASYADIPLKPGDTVLFYGNSMVERLCEQGELEAVVQLANPEKKLRFRSLAWTGDEVGWRARPEGYVEHLKNLLAKWPAQVVVAGFGLNESFAGVAGLADFRAQLDGYLNQLARLHPGAKLVLLSPIALEDGAKNSAAHNRDIEAYTSAIAEAAKRRDAAFVDLFTLTREAYARHSEPLTLNGIHLNTAGNHEIAYAIARSFVGEAALAKLDPARVAEVAGAAAQKSRYVADIVRPKNAVVYFGVRKRPDEYAAEMPRYHQLIEMADAIEYELLVNAGAKFADFPTPTLPPMPEGKARVDRFGAGVIKSPAEQQAEIKVADGYELNLFASEAEFPELRNPVQLTFDARGRLWVVTMPSWPHTVPGSKAADKILVLEDTDRDGKADKSTVFADGLDALDGIAFHEQGVIISVQPRLWLMKDENGDGRADSQRELLRGIDVTDSHHGGMIATDPVGHVMFCDGVFHRSQFETPFGVARGIDATTYRLDPGTGQIETEYQTTTPNPWKITFNRWGNIFQMYGDGYVLDGLPNTWTPLGVYHPNAHTKMLAYGKGSGAAIISSPNFPDEYQQGVASGTLLGSYFVALSRIRDKAGELTASDRLDVISSPNAAFRPVDIAFGMDGAMYVSDFCSAIIGHAQHPMRDPQWDHEHGRIWRVVFKGKPLVKDWPRIDGASVPELLALLTHPQDLVRHHVRIQLRAAADVVPALDAWINGLDRAHPMFEQAALEALWIYHAKGEARPALLGELLKSKEPQFRAAAVRLVRFQADRILDPVGLLHEMASDPDARVRMSVINVVSHLRRTLPQVEHSLHVLKGDEPVVKAMLADFKLGTKPAKGRSVPVLEVAPESQLRYWIWTGGKGEAKPGVFDATANAGNPKNGIYRTFLESDSIQPAILGVKHGYLDVSINGVQLLTSNTKWSTDQQVQFDLKKGLNLIEIAFRGLNSPPPAVYLYDPLGQQLASVRLAADEPSLREFVTSWDKANAATANALRVQAVPNQMQFAPTELRAKAGAIVKIIFENPDLMMHNFVLVDRGSEEEIGLLADKLAAQPDGMAKDYIPTSKKILQATPLVQPNGKAELEFTAPSEPGSYPYLCTFPGHWRIMKGVLRVE